jgi:hypothetical protein
MQAVRTCSQLHFVLFSVVTGHCFEDDKPACHVDLLYSLRHTDVTRKFPIYSYRL